MRVVPPQQEGSTETERGIHNVLLRHSLPGLPPEIATESSLRRARLYQSGLCAIIAAAGPVLCWYGIAHLAQDPMKYMMVLAAGLLAWLTASLPGLALALLALASAEPHERPILWTLTAINGALAISFFYFAGHYAKP